MRIEKKLFEVTLDIETSDVVYVAELIDRLISDHRTLAFRIEEKDEKGTESMSNNELEIKVGMGEIEGLEVAKEAVQELMEKIADAKTMVNELTSALNSLSVHLDVKTNRK